MLRKATYKVRVVRREALHVHDEFGHSLQLVELEGEPLHYEVGVAGELSHVVASTSMTASKAAVQCRVMLSPTFSTVRSTAALKATVTVNQSSQQVRGKHIEGLASWPASKARVSSRSKQERSLANSFSK